MTKFFQEFTQLTEGKFQELKFNSATYDRKEHTLTVRFIISTFERRNFGADKEAELLAAVKKMFNGVDVNVIYIKTYADADIVRNSVMQYFNRYQNMVFCRMKDSNLDMQVSTDEIFVKLAFETPSYKLLQSSNVEEDLSEYLDANFNQSVSVGLSEIPVDAADYCDVVINTSTAAIENPALRLINVTVDKNGKLYARGKIGSINQLPNYISDIKGSAENVILCGKVTNLRRRTYKNKNYNAEDKSTGPAEKPMISFILDDTTAKIDAVCFPKEEELQALEPLKDHDMIICTGKVSTSKFADGLSYATNAIFKCSIDFDSIRQTDSKPVPDSYRKIKPEPFREIKQTNFLLDETVPTYLKGRSFVVFDFEATSEMPSTAEPIEIAAAKMVDGKITETFQSLLKPTQQISEKITALTSITNEMVQYSPKFEDILPDFYKFCYGSILVGHNVAGYDYPILKRYAEELGYNFNNEIEDTLIMARNTLKESNKYSLEALTSKFNISHKNAHRAMSDVFATADLLKLIAKRL